MLGEQKRLIYKTFSLIYILRAKKQQIKNAQIFPNGCKQRETKAMQMKSVVLL